MDPIKVAQTSVVMVIVSARGRPLGSGSGVVVQDGRHVITNYHVAEVGDSYEIVLAPPSKAKISTTAVLVDFDETRDLAVLRLKDEIGTPVEIAPAGPELGDELVIAGYPGVGGASLTVTKGTVAGFLDLKDGLGDAWIKTDAAIAHGNSGGAALNSAGQLVGIPTFLIRSSGDSLGYLFSIQAGKRWVEEGVAKASPGSRTPAAQPTTASAVAAVPTATRTPFVVPANTATPRAATPTQSTAVPTQPTPARTPTAAPTAVPPGPPARIQLFTYPSAIARVVDERGNPVADGTPVEFWLGSAIGTVTPTCATTVRGTASVELKLAGPRGWITATAFWNPSGPPATCGGNKNRSVETSIPVGGS